MTTKEIDAKFEKMSRDAANKMNGTHPPKKPVKKTTKSTKRGK